MMNNLNININYQGVKIDVQFNHIWSMLSGYSGTGKTFLIGCVKDIK